MRPGRPPCSRRSPSPSRHPRPRSEPALRLTAVAPAALTPETGLAVTAELRAGDQALPPGSRVELRLQRSIMSTRGSVAGWTEQGLDEPVGSLLQTVQLPDGLAAGQTLPLAFQVPPGGTGLADRPDAWGPRGISVVLRGPTAARLGVVRSHVVWYPADADEQVVDQVGEPLGVTVVVPLTGPPPDPLTGVPDPVRLAEEVSGGGRLDAVLAGAARTGAVLALDPSVLDLRAEDGRGSGALGRRPGRRRRAAGGTHLRAREHPERDLDGRRGQRQRARRPAGGVAPAGRRRRRAARDRPARVRRPRPGRPRARRAGSGGPPRRRPGPRGRRRRARGGRAAPTSPGRSAVTPTSRPSTCSRGSDAPRCCSTSPPSRRRTSRPRPRTGAGR